MPRLAGRSNGLDHPFPFQHYVIVSCPVSFCRNYGATILPQMEAAQKGYTQVLWLFGEDNELTEVGTMNFFAFIKNKDGERELVTPPLDGTILPGVTRQYVVLSQCQCCSRPQVPGSFAGLSLIWPGLGANSACPSANLR